MWALRQLPKAPCRATGRSFVSASSCSRYAGLRQPPVAISRTALQLATLESACSLKVSAGLRSATSMAMTWPRRSLAPSAGGALGGVGSGGSCGSAVFGPLAQQVRCAGRKGGYKRKKKAMRPRTVHQRGLGKRMEFYWPKHDAHRTRVPLYENSRRHVIWDHRMRKWMVMWYRHGIQVFRSFPAKGGKFEQGRARAILFFQQLQNYGKLGRPKPDQCRSGVRGVYFDKEEKAWVARWSNCGMKTYAVYGTQELGFQTAYRDAVKHRIQSVRQNHQFVFQRTRWKGQRRPLGTPQT
ncbi:unnamed protein product [Polarella glacialis]|uniref:AP2/ERF domain-containing protein n=2 Tax=Polarella glacialis TaxID=89957 RepID=A0A813DRS0_POLGL|nr:unnamed protein product [Polarella glacialis]